VHWLTYAMWPVAVIHGIGTGTDPRFAWMLAIEAGCIGSVVAVVDPFTALGWQAAVIPFSSSYRRLWLGLGVVPIYLLVAIIITSLLRPFFGHFAWRAVHWLTYLMWPVAVIHGIGTGTDPRFVWMLGIEAVCIGSVVAAVAWRVSAPPHAAWRHLPAAAPQGQKWS